MPRLTWLCPSCGVAFDSGISRRTHFQEVKHGWLCPQQDCEKRLVGRKGVKSHCKAQHGVGQLYFCFSPSCCRAFIHRADFEVHNKNHASPATNEEDSDAEEYLAQDATHHDSDIIDDCISGNPPPPTNFDPPEVEDPEVDDAHRCARCALDFSTAAGLQDHFQKSKSHPKCFICGDAAYDLVYVKSHMNLPPRCHFCADVSDTLEQHIISQHPDIAQQRAGFAQRSAEESPDVETRWKWSGSSSQDMQSFKETTPEEARHETDFGSKDSTPPSIPSQRSPSITSPRSPILEDWELDSDMSIPSTSDTRDDAPDVTALSPRLSTAAVVEQGNAPNSGPDAANPGADVGCSSDNTANATDRLKWVCRLCDKEPTRPTAMLCGHIFCHECIIHEIATNLQCPTCKRPVLIELKL